MAGPWQEARHPGGLKSQERIGSSRAANPRRPDERTPGQVEPPEGEFEPSAAERGGRLLLRKRAVIAGRGRSRVGLGCRVRCSGACQALCWDWRAGQVANDSPTRTSRGEGGVERRCRLVRRGSL